MSAILCARMSLFLIAIRGIVRFRQTGVFPW